MSDYKTLTAKEMADGVKSGQLSAVELVKEAINLAKTEGKALNAFICLCEEKALKQAAAVDVEAVVEVLEGGEPGEFDGAITDFRGEAREEDWDRTFALAGDHLKPRREVRDVDIASRHRHTDGRTRRVDASHDLGGGRVGDVHDLKTRGPVRDVGVVP